MFCFTTRAGDHFPLGFYAIVRCCFSHWCYCTLCIRWIVSVRAQSGVNLNADSYCDCGSVVFMPCFVSNDQFCLYDRYLASIPSDLFPLQMQPTRKNLCSIWRYRVGSKWIASARLRLWPGQIPAVASWTTSWAIGQAIITSAYRSASFRDHFEVVCSTLHSYLFVAIWVSSRV